MGAHRAVDRPDDDSGVQYGIRGLVTESRPVTDRDDEIPEPRDSGADADTEAEVASEAAPEIDEEPPIEDGQTLRELLNERHLAPAETLRLGIQLADALAGLHRRGGVHGQLTPLTVRILPSGRARLLAPPDTPADALDPASVPYLSPEQVTGDPATPASDVYALGLVLLEAVTGYPAYPGSSWEAAAQRLTTPPVVPNEVPGPLAGTLLAMTQTAPGDRPTAERASARFGGGGAAPAPVPAPLPGAGMSQLVALGLPVVILLGLIAVALLNHHGSLSESTDNTAAPASAAPVSAQATTAPAATVAPATAAPNSAETPAAQPTTQPTTQSTAGPTAGIPTAGIPTAVTPPSGLALPDLKAPDLKVPDINVPDLPSSITSAITSTIENKAKSTWQQFTSWLGSLF